MIIKNNSVADFVEGNKDRNIIAIGAGSELLQYSYYKDEYSDFISMVSYIVDNDKEKQHKKYAIDDKVFQIYAIDDLLNMKIENPIFVVTCLAFDAIYNQLNCIDEYADCEIYFMKSMEVTPKIDLEKYITIENKKKELIEWRERVKKYYRIHENKRCFIIGNGPSLKAEDLEKIKKEISFASNFIYKIFDKTTWRPTYYMAIDYAFFSMSPSYRSNIGESQVFIPKERAIAEGKIYSDTVYYHRITDYMVDGKLTGANINFSQDVSEVVYGGGTVTYDMIQWAVYMGFKEIYLLGVDHTIFQGKGHFYDNQNQDTSNVLSEDVVMDAAYAKAQEKASDLDVFIGNATRGGRLEAFPRVDFDTLFS